MPVSCLRFSVKSLFMVALLPAVACILMLTAVAASARQADAVAVLSADSTASRAGVNEHDAAELHKPERHAMRPGVYYPDELENEHDWWKLLTHGKLNLKDTTVHYPRFLNFCVGVYRVLDRTLNGYDRNYVVDSDKKWMVMVKANNWTDGYSIDFDRKMSMRLLNRPYFSAGPYISYSGLSVGYSLDLSNILANREETHKKFELGFNCALFALRGYLWENDGGCTIRYIKGYNDDKLVSRRFPGVSMRMRGVEGYWYLNHRKYSQGAADGFGKIQKRTAGSWIFGLAYNYQNISLDFASLEQSLLDVIKIPAAFYRFHYGSVCAMAGYGVNWVFAKNWLFNITCIPEVGITKCREDSFGGTGYRPAFNATMKGALNWNIKDFFIGMQGSGDFNWYIHRGYYFLSAVIAGQVVAGVRF